MIDINGLKETLKDALSIEDVVDYYGIDKGMVHQFRCPGHVNHIGRVDKKIGNCYWNSSGRYFQCNCGAHGDIFSLIMEINCCSFMEAIDIATEIAGVDKSNFQATEETIKLAKERSTMKKMKPVFQLIGLDGRQQTKPLDNDAFSAISISGALQDVRSSAECIKNEFSEGELEELGAEYNPDKRSFILDGVFLQRYTSDKFEGRRWLLSSPVSGNLQKLKKEDPEAYQYLISSKVDEKRQQLKDAEEWGMKHLKGEFYKCFIQQIKEQRMLLAKAQF